jgi:hypothetical protein
MTKNDQNVCACEKTSCGCAPTQARCNCGERCLCESQCKCGSSCGCAEAKR